VQIIAKKNDWYKVKFASGLVGWMAAFLVKTGHGLAKVVSLSHSAPSTSHPFVRTAMAYRGAPYRRGSSLPSRGFDCSGLVYRVLMSNGIRPPRTSAGQYHLGTPVPRSELRPGDLVFFGGTYRSGISHVGIYIGGNKFIHAAHPGKGVCITSLDSSYYRRRFVGARRIR